MKGILYIFALVGLLSSIGCQGPVSQSKPEVRESGRRETLLTSRRFLHQGEKALRSQLDSDLQGLRGNLALDEALRGRLLHHYERDMEVWRAGEARERRSEGLFNLGPEKQNDSLQIFIDLNN